MTPSSLIFFVIITVWAVYVIQHWIRRRDHVATARSVDRFSEAMRVLERRRSVPQLRVTAPQRASYAVGLSRPAHPDVVVKRAQSRLTLVAGAAATEAAAVPEGTRPAPARPAPARPAPARTAVAAERGRARRTETASAPLLSAARVRALVLLVGVGLLAAGIALTVTGTWWAAPAGVLALGAALAYVRFSAARARHRSTSPVRHPSRRPQVPARAGRRGAMAAPAAQAGAVATTPARTRPARRRASGAPLTSAPVAAARVRGSAPLYVSADRNPTGAPGAGVPAVPAVPAAPAASAGARSALYDIEAVEAAAAPAATAGTEQQDAPAAPAEPGTWQPVPVPPPTYTLKARAPGPRARVAADTPVEDLPFDGNALALDEEFEDLPAVHEVG